MFGQRRILRLYVNSAAYPSYPLLEVPEYAAALSATIQPSEIERLADIGRLPIDSKRRTDPVERDADAIEHERAIVMRAESWAGAPPARVVAAWGHVMSEAPRTLGQNETDTLRESVDAAGRRGVVFSLPQNAIEELRPVFEQRAVTAIIVRASAAMSTSGSQRGAFAGTRFPRSASSRRNVPRAVFRPRAIDSSSRSSTRTVARSHAGSGGESW